MYELADYMAMIADGRRVRAHLAAMRAAIRPGDRVLELGTGFGFFAVAAARLGAAHVWALEPLDVIALGPSLARANEVEGRITFVQDVSTRFTLQPGADVLIEDMRGVSPLHGARLVALLDARARLLAPGARRIPARDRLLLTPCEPPRDHRRADAQAAAAEAGVDIGAALERADTAWRRIGPGDAIPLAAAACWAEVDYATFESPDVEGTASWEVERDGLLGGFVDSFEAELAEGVRYATGPGEPPGIHGCGWYPLATPVAVRRGDRVACRMRAKYDGSDYVMAWDTTHWSHGEAGEGHRQGASTLLDRAPSPARLARRAASHRPVLGADARLLRDALALVDGHRTLEEIAGALRGANAERLPDAATALRWTGTHLAALDETLPP